MISPPNLAKPQQSFRMEKLHKILFVSGVLCVYVYIYVCVYMCVFFAPESRRHKD